jgi:nitrogen fixation NifU-like protein
MQYSEKVMDHFMNPRNVGKVENPSGVGEVGNPTCGDIMHIEIVVKDDKIEDIKFQTFGCAAAIATSSMVTEIVKGKTLEEAEKITNRTVAEALDGLPPVKMHCSNLAADALHEAIKSYRQGGAASASVEKGCCQNGPDSSCEKGMEIHLPK